MLRHMRLRFLTNHRLDSAESEVLPGRIDHIREKIAEKITMLLVKGTLDDRTALSVE